MVAQIGEGPVFLTKKLLGLALLIVGCLLTALGFTGGYTGVTTLGIVLLVAGAILLVLKILRRNQDAGFGS
jgi:uncharacterized membrane protein HdeD (DUF308 family)